MYCFDAEPRIVLMGSGQRRSDHGRILTPNNRSAAAFIARPSGMAPPYASPWHFGGTIAYIRK